jgi:hypothetical protein
MSRPPFRFVAGIALTGARLMRAAQRVCVSIMVGPAARYRPEAYYMRGPGPKWQAKHAQIAQRTVRQR